jgi:cytidine deaminase
MTDDGLVDLVAAARAALTHAYAPYSGFRVGAAVRGASGAVYAGCNVENASYPVSMCAERGAIAAAIVAGETVLEAVAVVTAQGDPCAPCGMCRQALSEFGPDMEVLLAADDGRVVRSRLAALLPDAFGPAMLAQPQGRPNGGGR